MFDDMSLDKRKLQDYVRDCIFKEIQSNSFPNGKLPTETVLAKALGVSRATVSIALASMERDGVVIRRHGSATYVNKAFTKIKAQITEGIGVYDLIQKCGYVPSLKWNKTEVIPCQELPTYLVEKLGVGEESRITRISRLFAADGNPAVYLEEYIPCGLLKKEIDNNTLPETIYKLASEYCEKDIEFTVLDIVPCVPADFISNYFDASGGKGILLSEELHLDRLSNPLIFSKVYTYDKYIRYQAIRIRK